jgi:hypothetical protein
VPISPYTVYVPFGGVVKYMDFPEYEEDFPPKGFCIDSAVTVSRITKA